MAFEEQLVCLPCAREAEKKLRDSSAIRPLTLSPASPLGPASPFFPGSPSLPWKSAGEKTIGYFGL